MPGPIGPIEIVSHTHAMTQLADYPMFQDMLSQLKWMLGIAGTLIMVMVGAMWRGLHVRIGSHRVADTKKCDDCKADHDMHTDRFLANDRREKDALWKNVDAACAASGVSPIKKKDLQLQQEAG